MLLIMTICAVFIGLLMQHRRTDLERYIAEQVKSARAIAQIIEEEKSSQYRKRIKSLVNYKTSVSREKLLQAFARQDRDALQKLALPFLKFSKKKVSIFLLLAGSHRITMLS